MKGRYYVMDTSFDSIMNFLNEPDVDEIQLDAADESAIFLAAMQDTCTPEEYQQMVMENTTELALYGLIEDADIVTEATKIVKHKITKQENLNREQSKAALRLAKKADSAEWKKYEKGRKMMLEAKAKIFQKYASRAKTEAKKVLKNSKRKSSSMPSVTGKTISQKMDKKLKEYE